MLDKTLFSFLNLKTELLLIIATFQSHQHLLYTQGIQKKQQHETAHPGYIPHQAEYHLKFGSDLMSRLNPHSEEKILDFLHVYPDKYDQYVRYLKRRFCALFRELYNPFLKEIRLSTTRPAL